MWRAKTPRHIEEERPDYWVSYSDLMAGLVLVFILLLCIFIMLSKKDLEVKQKELEDQRQILEARTSQLRTVDQDVSRVLGIREELLRRVKTRFESTGDNISFDDATGALRLGSNILFKEGSADLSEQGTQTLERVVPLYYEALLGDEKLREHVDQIIFEGHTNSNFSGDDNPDRAYLFNLQLSQKRAYSAMEHIIRANVGASYEANKILAANGYSSSRLILSNGEEDKTRSRRLEIKFRLKDERSLNQLREMFLKLEPVDDGVEQP